MGLTDLQKQAFLSTQVPTQELCDYDANSNLIYQGYAKQGVGQTEAKWVIHKNSYDGTNRFTGLQTATNVAWSNRTTATYT